MVHTMSHTEVLQCSADDIWGACKHADDILPHLMPDFFTKSVFLQGHGEPGSIRIVKLGPAAPHAAEVKERMDTFDDATKTLGYTVLEGDRRYSSFSAQMKFVPAGKTTEAIWTATYEPVGDMGPPEHIKQIVVLVFKTLERAVLSRKTLSHTETLDASPDAIWEACKHADELLPKAMPEFFTSSTFLQGHGEPGSIRVVKMGPAIPHAGEVTERMDLFDEASKTLGYTVLQGDSRYHYFSATMKFAPGAAAAGTTDATWTATYVPVGDMGPPEHIKQIAILVFKALAGVAKANPTVA
ncbi:unnamed protein product [Sphagnum troendelagicum]|uniref:Bet v I/Major latex protein domain-containing protein n=1 Tax=Sphagnum troendelagicum TaxID=128251 RepID=A0ABP0TSB3_9BRYO|nr:hypothetical protein BDL97_14G035600 [Sphagnum fallax]